MKKNFILKNIEEFKIEILKLENKIKDSSASQSDEDLRKYHIDLHNEKSYT
jgi:hypothetical protein